MTLPADEGCAAHQQLAATFQLCGSDTSMIAQALGVPEVQIHEPILTLSDAAALGADFAAAYAAFAEVLMWRKALSLFSPWS